ncbi:hypothetical protein E4U54_007509 [Claviceps lovelessii]|nr:hypothetical protein E4U54_007509 [Claviceps lovelessii]
MLLRSSYLAYKRETSRLVYLLVTASNAILSVKNVKAKLNTSGKLDSSGFVPSAELIGKHMRSVPREILRLLKSVIELRTSHYAEFQRRVSANPNFRMEESNKSHKHFIDVLSRAFEILGGESGLELKKEEAEADERELGNEDFEATCSNMFAHLDLQDVHGSDGEDDDGSVCDAGDVSSHVAKRDPTENKTGKSTHGKQALKIEKKKKKKKKDKHHSRLGKMSIEQYGILDDDHHIAAEYFLAASSLLEQSIDLRIQCQEAWSGVAHDQSHPLLAVATSGQSIAMVQKSHATICRDFPGPHSYMGLINTYTKGGPKNLARKTTIRISQRRDSDDCCVSMEETAVSREPMRELLMEHAYNDLVDFLHDFRKTSSGVPTKQMKAEISRWDPEYDLEEATDDQLRQWRRVYTINWLYGLVGYYFASKAQVDRHGTSTKPSNRPCRKSATPWAEDYSFFGLGQFARSIITLTRRPAEAPIQDSITPVLVFQLQCIVDSFTASRGWIVEVSGHVVHPPPVEDDLPPEQRGVMGWFWKVTCANPCEHHQGLSRSIELLRELHARCRTRPGAFGESTFELVWNSWWQHHRIVVDLRNGTAPCFRHNDADGRLDEYGLFALSPFLCGFATLQTLELFYRYAMFVWDTTPEIVLMLHLHNMLHRTGYLKEPVALMAKLTASFGRDLFGESTPTCDFYKAFVDRKAPSRPITSSLVRPFVIETPSFRQFHMSERVFRTRSSVLVFHEAGWESAAVSPDRVSSLSEQAWLRYTVANLGNRSSFDSRKRLAKIPKTGHNIDLPHFDPDSDHIHESTVLSFGRYAMQRDMCTCCPAPLTGLNLLAVTAKLLSIWLAIGQKLERSNHVRAHHVGRATSSLSRDAVETVATTALRGSDDSLNKLLADVFEETRTTIGSVSYFTSGDEKGGLDRAS